MSDAITPITPIITPIMKQYLDLKTEAGDALLLFRMGDFYELFGEDALIASRILEITLTSRDKNKENPMPMAGVPHHSAQTYIQRLLKAGHKVAIGEQIKEPPNKLTSKLVKREIVRVFSPAIQFDEEAKEANYLATAIAITGPNPKKKQMWILACLDASTGETLVSDPIQLEDLSIEIGNLPIRHLLKIGGSLSEEIKSNTEKAIALIEELPSNYLPASESQAVLEHHYGLLGLDTFLQFTEAKHALAILIHYTARSQKQKGRLSYLRLPVNLHHPQSLKFGPRSSTHLDLPDLFDFINHTRSSLGTRELRRWLMEPLSATPEIKKRQDAIKELRSISGSARAISEKLSQLYDLERISARVNSNLANPRDSLALGRSIDLIPALLQNLEPATVNLICNLKADLDCAITELGPLRDNILHTQCDAAPISPKDGNIFKVGTHPDLDRLIELSENGQRFLVDLEGRERASTGIGSLKVRYNRVFGYYIEVTQAHLKSVPSHYQRKQTMVGAERFFTGELKKFEDEITTATEKRKTLEEELFSALINNIQTHTEAIMKLAKALGALDALISLVSLCDEPGWVFPEIDDSLSVSIKSGRHPLVDKCCGGKFVPNDLSLSPESRMSLLITGPNMGGKSTLMRQIALLVILGQLGAPVPASEARWGVFSSIYTRIGAQDAIARGQSTFMVEMSELAHILHNADSRSLIILDEIGRGTSTYDGVSVAWATLEWICNNIKARTLFATHYHELTRLVDRLPCLDNAHMAVANASQLRFLYELRPGPTNDSFGIHVAELAGLPRPLIRRAWSVLEELEQAAPLHEDGNNNGGTQLSLFSPPLEPKNHISAQPPPPAPPRHPVVDELNSADLNTMTPLEALNFLARLKDSNTT